MAQFLIEESQQSSGCNGRTDDSRNVWSHGVHEKEVVAVVFQTQVVGDARTHWYGAHSGVSDKWVQFFAFWQEEIHQLDE